MPKSEPKSGKNTDPSPMTYEVKHFPSLAQRRAQLAADAENMNMTDLRTAAAEAQIDTGGAKTKEEVVSAVRHGARGTEVAPIA